MQLHFHGSKYEAESLTLEVIEGSTGGLYRGSPWKLHHLTRQYHLRPRTISLTYRGATYKA